MIETTVFKRNQILTFPSLQSFKTWCLKKFIIILIKTLNYQKYGWIIDKKIIKMPKHNSSFYKKHFFFLN